jgi:hypothetical protein
MNTLLLKAKYTLAVFLPLLAFTACTHRQVYKNNSGRCKLSLYADGTYRFTYPMFLGKGKEQGSYRMDGNTVLLKRETMKTGDSTGYSAYYLTDRNDSLLFRFRNLNDSSIAIQFTMNNFPKMLRSDESGSLKMAYSDLRKMGIVEKDRSIHGIAMTYNNTLYIIRDTLFNPTQLDIQLNQYVGKTAVLYRRFQCKGDTIIVNGIDPKAIGLDRYLRKR